jgi:hypothetical protein
MSKAEKLVEILDGMSSEWVTSDEEEDAFHVANAELVAGVVAEARAAVLRELREEIVENEDEWDTTYSAEPGVSWKELLTAIDRRLA